MPFYFSVLLKIQVTYHCHRNIMDKDGGNGVSNDDEASDSRSYVYANGTNVRKESGRRTQNAYSA